MVLSNHNAGFVYGHISHILNTVISVSEFNFEAVWLFRSVA